MPLWRSESTSLRLHPELLQVVKGVLVKQLYILFEIEVAEEGIARNAELVLFKNGEERSLPLKTKPDLAKDIVNAITELLK